MLPTIKRKLFPVFLFVLLFIAPLQSGAQIAGGDLCTVTIESVKCITPSTGQDVYTQFLFKGIELAMTAAKAFATAGASLTVDVALEIAKTTAKSALKSAMEITVKNQDFYKGGKQQLLEAVKKQSNGNATTAFVMDGVQTYLTYTSLEGLFNKVYGTSPDDLYIRVNGNKIWPSGKYASITSQQQHAVGFSFNIAKNRSFNIGLMEYDYGSGDDDLGELPFKIPDNFTGTTWIRDKVIQHEEEGSLYLITLRVESQIKHRFINDLANSGWDIKVNNTPAGVLVFEEDKVSLPDLATQNAGWNGFLWGINYQDNISIFNPVINSVYLLTFNSENSFSGFAKTDNKSTITGTRRSSMHRYINNLVGSSWKNTNVNGDGLTCTFQADGTLRYNNSNVAAMTWHVSGPDKITRCDYNSCETEFTFTSENNATADVEGTIASSTEEKYTIARVNSSGQVTQNLQHRFITNIVGTIWNFSDPAGGNFSFSFGDDKITNVSPAGTFWDAVTWRVFGNDIIELRANNGATMNISFTDQNNFTGNSWIDKNKVVTGSTRQVQQPLQSSETLPSRFINNISGTTWYFEDPAGGNVRFTFGQGNFINVSPAGTLWDEVTWKPVARDVIEVRAKTGAVMEFYFSQNSFVGRSWYNNDVVVSGSTKPQQGQAQQQESFPHRFINNLVGSSWTFTEGPGYTHTFTFGNGVISNSSNWGATWDKFTWKFVGTDMIQLRAPEGALMNLTFSDEYNFNGTLWNGGYTPVTGTKR